MDADPAGRAAAVWIAHDLEHLAASVRIADLHAGRNYGADLTDWLIAHLGRPVDELRELLSRSTTLVGLAAPDLLVDSQFALAPEETLERVTSRCLGGRSRPRCRNPEIARAVSAAAGELQSKSDAELQALAAKSEAAWRVLDQPAARQAVAVGEERDRAAAVLAGVKASMQELASQRGDSRRALEYESQLRDERLRLRERSDALAHRIGTIDAQLAQLAVRYGSPQRWAPSHRDAFVQGLAARHVLTSRHSSPAVAPTTRARTEHPSQPRARPPGDSAERPSS